MRRLLVWSFLVVVVCGTPLASARTLALSGNIVVEATGPLGATVTYDNGGFDCTPPSGSVFPLGLTTVTCLDAGVPAGSFTVTVLDRTAPTLTVPGPQSVSALGVTTPFNYSGLVSASDLVDPAPSVLCSPASPGPFPLSVTTVTCKATDSSGNASAESSFSVTVSDTTAPDLIVPADQAVTATGLTTPFAYVASATDNLDPTPTVLCTPPSPGPFLLGATTVSCTASDNKGNSVTKAFKVTVSDLTPPLLTVPGDRAVIATGTTTPFDYSGLVSATDNIDPTPTILCTPASPGPFPLGETTVSCTATDASSQSTTKTFKITVSDTTAPQLTVPGAQAVTATGATTPFDYSGLVSATDIVDPSPTVLCSPTSPGPFLVGETTVTCTATDSSAQSTTKTFTVTVTDTTAPDIAVPANVTAEATGPTGAAVTYPPVTASDQVDGTIAASCSPASGSTFGLGDTTVTCNAADARGNRATAKTFTITVRDTTPAMFSGVPGLITVEANGPSGSIVNFTNPTAVDLVDGPIAGVVCAPAAASRFPLGTTTVTCRVTDAHGNTGSRSFNVKVADTTPPNLVVPVATSVNATTPTGIPNTVSGIVSFVSAASASDIADPAPVVTNNVPSFLPVGNLTVVFTARDASGNGTSKEVTLIVLPQPPAGTPPLPVPPAPKPPTDVRNLTATPGDGSVRLAWQTPGGVDHVILTRAGQVVYSGSAASYVDRGLENGTEYRYVVVTVDAAGKRSVGVAVVAVPRQRLLLAPRDGARVKAPKSLQVAWARMEGADYYNAQFFFDQSSTLRLFGSAESQAAKKVLSVWPKGNSFVLKRSWKYAGVRYRLRPGVYRWYVWPGYGNRKDAKYGPLMGSSSFVVVP